jgi:methylmalonyl-CoA mutase cobalamin-binding subunit
LKTVIAGALGECVHVAGINNFLHLAEEAGWKTVFLGPAVSIDQFLSMAKSEQADMVGVSYRLTPETGERLLAEFAEAADELRESGVRFVFGGTPPVAEKAKASGFFERVFDGNEGDVEVLRFLRSQETGTSTPVKCPEKTIERIHWKQPYPLLRHHFGLPTLAESVDGIRKIAESQVLDVISLGIDQDAQENFFHPERQDPRRKGAGGVPVRSAQDYSLLFQASRCGNFPLMRTYSGTDDFIPLAELVTETIQNAWCAIPLFWFNQMDGRGPWDLEGSIKEHQQVMKWYGERQIPVELNEPHHWGMRDAPDVIYVVAAYLSVINAKAFGVRDYIAQFMFNSPPGLSDRMDLAKMLAILELIEPLADENFHIWRQTRTGLLSYPLDPIAARAHLVASIYLQMAMKPHIVHVVGFSEADHAATADDVIESCQLAQRAIENAIKGAPDMTADAIVQSRIKHLVSEATFTLDTIRSMGDGNDALLDPKVLTEVVQSGILDAPQLKNNRFGLGKIRTRILNGGCEAIDGNGNYLSETDRIIQIRQGKIK